MLDSPHLRARHHDVLVLTRCSIPKNNIEKNSNRDSRSSRLRSPTRAPHTALGEWRSRLASLGQISSVFSQNFPRITTPKQTAARVAGHLTLAIVAINPARLGRGGPSHIPRPAHAPGQAGSRSALPARFSVVARRGSRAGMDYRRQPICNPSIRSACRRECPTSAAAGAQGGSGPHKRTPVRTRCSVLTVLVMAEAITVP